MYFFQQLRPHRPRHPLVNRLPIWTMMMIRTSELNTADPHRLLQGRRPSRQTRPPGRPRKTMRTTIRQNGPSALPPQPKITTTIFPIIPKLMKIFSAQINPKRRVHPHHQHSHPCHRTSLAFHRHLPPRQIRRLLPTLSHRALLIRKNWKSLRKRCHYRRLVRDSCGGDASFLPFSYRSTEMKKRYRNQKK